MAKNKKDNSDFMSKCSFCGGEFGAQEMTVLEEKEQKTTLHATCRECKTSALFFISNGQAGLLSLGVATDLDKEEVKNKFSRFAVTADEVIDAHQLVSQGDVAKLFQ
ncbi:MAG TPA: hypothetical protein DIT25_04295 [Candidatus Moranbacteria bacterium]|nr:hypothetical protein [Candidatus Moranbacteria bacterium]